MPSPISPLQQLQLLEATAFADEEASFASFNTTPFRQCSPRRQLHQINNALLSHILAAPAEAFVLPAVVHFLERVNSEKLLPTEYHITAFEFWLNHFSGLSYEENYRVRGKIAGKLIPRESYQALFPIGMGKTYFGSHYVAAHQSPDVDTTIASFWGWLDAFAARVGTSMHYWNIPEGPPDSPVLTLFQNYFGVGAFQYLARFDTSLTLNAADLLTQDHFIKAKAETSINTLDSGYEEKAVVLIDDAGRFLGEWRSSDVESIRQVIILFKACLHWFENDIHLQLISLFAKEVLHSGEIAAKLRDLFESPISQCEPVLEYNEEQKRLLNDFFSLILLLPKGLSASFFDMGEALKDLGLTELSHFLLELNNFDGPKCKESKLFDSQELLIENRPQLFRYLEKIFKELDSAIFHIRDFVERLDISLQIKSSVLQVPLKFTSLRTDVDAMRYKMNTLNYLTITMPEAEEQHFPVGVVWSRDLRRKELGTVSFRDFCNLNEVRMANYLTVISVIDHHKSALHTEQPPMALIGDAQSCNTLLAELAFTINDRYSTAGMTAEHISAELALLERAPFSAMGTRLQRRLLLRQLAAAQRHSWFVHPAREMSEYLFFLHAILDDTDLLTKVSQRDVECVAELINRLKSLSQGSEREEICFDQIVRDEFFAKTAAAQLLHHPLLYSVYQGVYALRQKEVEKNLLLGGQGMPSNWLLDTKEINGLSRVGQTKMFSNNFPTFCTVAEALRSQWVALSREVQIHRPEVDLFLHMISTIASAEEVYTDVYTPYTHNDELWIWLPNKQQSRDHLAAFLAAFQNSAQFPTISFEVEVAASCPDALEELMRRIFTKIIRKAPGDIAAGQPLAILRFPAATLNSRKSMISPYLPTE